MSLVSATGLAGRIEEWNRRLAMTAPAAVGVVVADRVTQESRAVLRAAGWGWLDLRGHLHVAGQGLFIDTDVPAVRVPANRSAPLAGQVGIEVAALLLLTPEIPAAVRKIAGRLGRAPSSVSAVLRGIAAQGLLDTQRLPSVPGLFWELAARWKPAQAHVQRVPVPGDGAVHTALKLGLDNVEQTTGWALSDTVAAAVYGAPVSIRAHQPRDFYVPDQATWRRAVRLLGETHDHAGRAATVRAAPVTSVCSHRVDATGWTNESWPLAQPLFVALDLAQDPGRGQEILANWTPHDRWRRVW
jgi:hypothetical protein